VPVDSGGSGPQGLLYSPVEPLHQPVPLQVVSSCGRVVEVEQAAQGGAQGGRELSPSGGGDGGRHSELGDPAGKQGSGAVGSGDGGEWNCLWPPKCSVEVWLRKDGSRPTRST
jgi:hypothetical protein